MTRDDTSAVHARKLVHDVGKYVSRAARNIHETPLSEVLHAMLLDDLYALDGTRSAFAVFNEIAANFEAAAGKNPRIEASRALLLRIEALSEAVHEKEWSSVQEAARLAVEVDNELRRLLTEMHTEDDK